MAEHNDTGIRGEDIAVKHLMKKSYTILETNWRTGRMEIDIIARLGNQLVIAEVKTRHSGFLESPEGAVNKKKQNLLVRAANIYVKKTNLDLDIRFDIITIILENRSHPIITHIENAFLPVVRS